MNIGVGWVNSSEPLLSMSMGKFCHVHKQFAMPAFPREAGVPRCILLLTPPNKVNAPRHRTEAN